VLEQHASSSISSIHGTIYAPHYLNSILSQLCQYLFFCGLFLLLAGDAVFSHLQFTFGLRAVNWMKANYGICLMGLMALNWLSGQLLATGAFEVYYNDILVFSRLESGAVPDVDYLLRELKKMATRPQNSY